MKPVHTLHVVLLCGLLAAAVSVAVDPSVAVGEEQRYRIWTDASGRFQTRAKLLRVQDGIVHLQKRSGSMVAVPLTRLSDANRQYLSSLETPRRDTDERKDIDEFEELFGDAGGDAKGETPMDVEEDMKAAAAKAENPPQAAPSDDQPTGAGTYVPGTFARRGPTHHAELIEKYGGPEGTQQAVDLALKWLAAHQMPDGGWSFNHAMAPMCGGRCRNPGSMPQARNAATAMALLPLLGAGQTHKAGKYTEVVKRGFYFLVNRAKAEPAMGNSFHEKDGTMYSHGLASLALCEAYGMTHDKALQTPAQGAIDFIAHAQDPAGGGWRYNPRQAGDTSVSGWQILALKSAHLAYLRVPPITVKKGFTFLDSVQSQQGAAYGYTTAQGSDATSAIGLLCRMYLGWKRDNPALVQGVKQLSEKGPSKTDLYYDFFATEVMWHYGGQPWKDWNAMMPDLLIASQATDGHETGSWHIPGDDQGAKTGGRLYCTAMATLILETYFRQRPIYATTP